jgi:large subunit ribosomal protein L31
MLRASVLRTGGLCPAKGLGRQGPGLSIWRWAARLTCFAFLPWLITENPFAHAGYVRTRSGLALPMKDGIHPAYVVTTVTCSCGNTFVTRSTKKEIRVDICSACHPFFTGKLKYVDTAGRIEKFQSKFAAGTYNSVQKPAAKAAKKRKPAPTTEEY